MSDMFEWLWGLGPAPLALLVMAFVGLMFVAYVSHLYCEYRNEVRWMEERRQSQLQTLQHVRETQVAVLNGLIEAVRLRALGAETSESPDDQESEGDSKMSA